MSDTGSVQRDDERLFFYAVIVASSVITAAFCWLMFSLNNREKEFSSQNELILAAKHSEARLIPPDHPRQLVDFSLTDRTGCNVTRADVSNSIIAASRH